ncbi:MAG: hypothetical protein IGS49_08025 [Chlorogloeopsis fritschii C42_A2020_084]|nr:hypothetical protein [Chlorogloeopsis fritschii C42_A2020_084]
MTKNSHTFLMNGALRFAITHPSQQEPECSNSRYQVQLGNEGMKNHIFSDRLHP